MKYLKFLWQLAITPVYYILLAATAFLVLIGLGVTDFKDFWRKNK